MIVSQTQCRCVRPWAVAIQPAWSEGLCGIRSRAAPGDGHAVGNLGAARRVVVRTAAEQENDETGRDDDQQSLEEMIFIIHGTTTCRNDGQSAGRGETATARRMRRVSGKYGPANGVEEHDRRERRTSSETR